MRTEYSRDGLSKSNVKFECAVSKWLLLSSSEVFAAEKWSKKCSAPVVSKRERSKSTGGCFNGIFTVHS